MTKIHPLLIALNAISLKPHFLKPALPTLALVFSQFCLGQTHSKELSESLRIDSPHAIHEEVLVTGSLITSNENQLGPVSAWQANGPNFQTKLRLDTFLQSLPQTTGPGHSLTTGGFSTLSGGLSTINLRGLGPQRTLILVNGKRVVGGNPRQPSVVDINAIPSTMIERVEVFSGGAAAAYGSDAIAGVVNIITKADYQGGFINAHSGLSHESDADQLSVTAGGGTAFDEGRGNIAFSLYWDKNEPIYSRDRAFSKNNERLGNREFFSIFTPTGTIVSENGPVVANDSGQWVTPYNPAQYGYNQADERQLSIPLERLQWQLSSAYQLSENSSFYGELRQSLNDSSNQQEPSVLIFNNRPTPLPSTYPYFPSEVLASWTDAGESIPPQIPYYRRLSELGPRTYKQSRNTLSFLTGVKTEFGQWLSDISYQYGKTQFSQASSGHYNTTRMAYALDVETDPANPGDFRCASEEARVLGCAPADIFSTQSINQSTLDFIRAQQFTDSEIQMEAVNLRLQGPLLALPAGPMETALGVDWRKEAIHSVVDALTLSGQTSSVALSGVNGEEELKEAFIELKIPLLDQNWVDHLGLSLAYRLSDYSSVGTMKSWNTGLTFKPTQRVQFYARRGLAIRAPSVSELYMPESGGVIGLSDPCDAAANVPAQVTINCAAEGVPEDYSPTDFERTVPYRTAGNTALNEERGFTTTYGFSIDALPHSLLTLRADYFDINIKGAIVVPNIMFSLNNCYASSNFPNNEFCAPFNRNGADQNFTFNQINRGPENIGLMSTRGVDISLLSSISLWGGTLKNHLTASRTLEWEQTSNGSTLDRVDEPGFQSWKGLYTVSFVKPKWHGALLAHYLGSAVIENNSTTDYIQQNNDLPSVTYFDLHLSRNISLNNKNIEPSRLSVYASINNLTDKQPPYVPADSRSGTRGTSTAANVYDVLGRLYRVGMKYQF